MKLKSQKIQFSNGLITDISEVSLNTAEARSEIDFYCGLQTSNPQFQTKMELFKYMAELLQHEDEDNKENLRTACEKVLAVNLALLEGGRVVETHENGNYHNSEIIVYVETPTGKLAYMISKMINKKGCPEIVEQIKSVFEGKPKPFIIVKVDVKNLVKAAVDTEDYEEAQRLLNLSN